MPDRGVAACVFVVGDGVFGSTFLYENKNAFFEDVSSPLEVSGDRGSSEVIEISVSDVKI